MNKLVLIGNGFDLAHGLKTKYSDFLLWYLNNSINTLYLNHDFNDVLIGLNIKGWSYEYPPLNSLSEFKDFIKKYDIEFSTKTDFVTKIIFNKIPNKWVDIESHYYTSLIEIYESSKTLGRDIENELVKLNVAFYFIKTQLIEYLLTIGNISPTNEEIKGHFISELVDAQDNDEKNNTMFLNFNYTSAIEIYKDALPSDLSSEVIYIHGNLKDEMNPIIFGYGDEMDTYYEMIEQLNNNEFTKNIKSFDYLKTSNYQNFSRFIDTAPFDVYIMGHSCGLSDRILLNSIFEHDNCEKIKIFYYQKTRDENDFFEKTQEISRHFRPINKGKMRNKIVPYSECKPLIAFKD